VTDGYADRLAKAVDDLEAELRQQAHRFESLDAERVAEMRESEQRERIAIEQLHVAEARAAAADADSERFASELRRIRASRSWRIAELLSGIKNSKGHPARIRRAVDRFRAGTDATVGAAAAAVAVPISVLARESGDVGNVQVSVVLRLRTWDPAFLATIAGLEQQTVAGLELVIVDEGLQPEQIGSVVERASSLRRLVVGRGWDARRLAAGRYLCELDAPLRFEPTYLEKAVILLDHDPGVTVVGAWIITSDGELWRPADLVTEYLAGESAPAGAVLRRSARSERRLRRTISEPLVRELRPRPGRAESQPRPEERLEPRHLAGNSLRPVVLTLPWFTLGGGDRVVEALLRHWQSQGRSVVAITTVDLGAGMADRFGELLELTPFAYHLPRLLPADAWVPFVEDLVASRDDPTLLNVGSPWFYGALSQLRSRFPNLHVVDQQFNDIGHLPGNRFACSYIDVTIAAYNKLAETIVADGRAASSVAVVPVGIQPIRPADERDAKALRASLEIPDHHRIVSFVGRLSPEKRPEWALALAAELADEDGVSVLLVGDGPLADVLRGGIDAVPSLIWRRSVESIEPLLAITDVIIVPSRIEGIPLVVMEALTLGVPVVATRVGGLPELEADPLVRLCEASEYNSFVTAVRETLAQPPDTRQWRPDAFSMRVMLDEYDRLIDDRDR